MKKLLIIAFSSIIEPLFY